MISFVSQTELRLSAYISTTLRHSPYVCNSSFQLLNHALAHPLPHNCPLSTPNPLPRSLYVLVHTNPLLCSQLRPHPITLTVPLVYCINRSLDLPYLAPTLFCKCTCFSNSTIIPLNAPRPASSHQQQFASRLLLHTRNQDDGNGAGGRGEGGGGDDEGKKGNEDRKEFRAGNCGDCNRQYCIDAHLPICKDATVGDVVATCFRASPSFLFSHQPNLHLHFLPPPAPAPLSLEVSLAGQAKLS